MQPAQLFNKLIIVLSLVVSLPTQATLLLFDFDGTAATSSNPIYSGAAMSGNFTIDTTAFDSEIFNFEYNASISENILGDFSLTGGLVDYYLEIVGVGTYNSATSNLISAYNPLDALFYETHIGFSHGPSGFAFHDAERSAMTEADFLASPDPVADYFLNSYTTFYSVWTYQSADLFLGGSYNITISELSNPPSAIPEPPVFFLMLSGLISVFVLSLSRRDIIKQAA